VPEPGSDTDKAADGTDPCARIGHNGGPPLVPPVSGVVYRWRKARAEARRISSPEMARRRVRQARACGLSLEALTSFRLQTGRTPTTIVTGLRGTLIGTDPGGRGRLLGDRLDQLRSLEALFHLIFAIGEPAESAQAVQSLIKRLAEAGRDGPAVSRPGETFARERDAQRLRRFLGAHDRPPSASFFVGTRVDEQRASEEAGLGLFLLAPTFFRDPVSASGEGAAPVDGSYAA